jgi:ketosteroid isomerase-like protein
MTVEAETRRVVESYFAAWTTKDVSAAHALLAGDLEFSGPTASYQSADAFLPALAKFAEMSKWARIVDLVVEGNRAALLYDCELPQPVGKLRIASFFRVEKGKIRVYETLFDATELRQLQARQRAGQ